MIQEDYNRLNRFFHAISLGSRTISELSFEINRSVFYSSKKINEKVENTPVFISGLARSGTTALLNHLFETKEFATLTYSDMPFILAPNLWQKLKGNTKQTALRERAHGDQIFINNHSPEAMDEVFWKVFLNNEYIKDDCLKINTISQEVLSKFKEFTELICLNNYTNQPLRYLSKNNNSILRINSLKEQFRNCHIIVPFRSPLEHAQSLLNQHKHFCSLQHQNPFILKYMNWIGHYEFGLNQKPFDFPPLVQEELNHFSKQEINYWLKTWFNYYTFILNHPLKNEFIFVNYENLCQKPLETLFEIKEKINLKFQFQKIEPFILKEKMSSDLDSDGLKLFKECMNLYEKIKSINPN